ncbi:GAF domain-containing protein [Glutamicibacter sp. NPDC087661]|uniref:GAF domain-containing protein n=1 Tax=Glutamicibacter sp. NPDC087661 TaxID=3363996 RepID=UPI0038216B22
MNKDFRVGGIKRAWNRISVFVFVLCGLLSSLILAFTGLGFEWMKGWLGAPDYWVSAILGIVLGVAGSIGATAAAVRRESAILADGTALMDSTLIPTAKLLIGFMALQSTNESSERQVVTGIVGRLREYLKAGKPLGFSADANFYLLINGNSSLHERKLVRINETETGARVSFNGSKATKLQSDTAKEEAAVIARVCQEMTVQCNNINDESEQERLSLDPNQKRSYKSFVSVPVVIENRSGGSPTPEVIGMLSVNADQKNYFQRQHLVYISGIARLIGKLHEERSLTPPAKWHTVSNGKDWSQNEAKEVARRAERN